MVSRMLEPRESFRERRRSNKGLRISEHSRSFLMLSSVPPLNEIMRYRTAKDEEEERRKSAVARTPKVLGPGLTPRRSAGIGAGARVTATPRRTGGI